MMMMMMMAMMAMSMMMMMMMTYDHHVDADDGSHLHCQVSGCSAQASAVGEREQPHEGVVDV